MRRSRMRSLMIVLVLAVATLGFKGCWCNSDLAIGPKTTEEGPYDNFQACETKRKGTDPCPLITSDPACTAHCKASSWPGGCFARIKNASSTPAAACFQKQADEKYYYSCTQQATCECF